MSNPYEDENDSSGADATARALAEMRSDIAERQDEESGVQMEVGAPVHEESEEDDSGMTPRRQARSDRGKRFRENKNREIEEARGESAQLRNDLARMQGQIDAMQRAPHASAPQEDPWDKEFKAEETAQHDTYNAFTRATQGYASQKQEMPPEEYKDWVSRNSKHSQNIASITVRREMAAQNTPEKLYHDRMTAKYPDVMMHDRAREWAINMYAARAAAGEVGDEAGAAEKATERVMNDARRQFRLGEHRSPPPTERQESSYGRMGRGGGAPSPRQGQTVTLTEAEQRMAMETYKHSDMTRPQKMQAWLNETSKQ